MCMWGQEEDKVSEQKHAFVGIGLAAFSAEYVFIFIYFVYNNLFYYYYYYYGSLSDQGKPVTTLDDNNRPLCFYSFICF